MSSFTLGFKCLLYQQSYPSLKRLCAIRGIKYQTSIFRSNPYLLSNWFVQECYRDVMVDEAMMLQGSGNQLEEKQETLYHYMRCDVNKFIDKPN
jgi:hypothetical protein